MTVCTLETTASLDIRVLDFNDPDDRGDHGSKCILQRQDDYEGTIVYQKEGDSSCQNFLRWDIRQNVLWTGCDCEVCADSALQAKLKYKFTAWRLIVRIPRFRTKTATTISQCWSLVANFQKNMHAGVIPSTIDVFDPIEDKLLLEANSRSEPEALLFSLHICDETIRGYRQNGYRGCQTKTTSGRTCQRWTSQSPHEHSNTPRRYLDKGPW